MPGAGKRDLARLRLEYAVHHGDKFVGRHVADQHAIELLQGLAWREIQPCKRAERGAGSGHQQRSGHPFAADVGENDAEAAGAELDPVEPVTGDGTGGLPGTVKAEARDERRGLRDERLLDGARLRSLAVHALVKETLLTEEAGVFDG